jgi:hypothetical protein
MHVVEHVHLLLVCVDLASKGHDGGKGIQKFVAVGHFVLPCGVVV